MMRSFARGISVAALAVLLLGSAFAAPAVAAEGASEFFFQAPEDGNPGSSANELKNPRGIASDPSSGHFYVSDADNARIDEFTVWGEFVKAFGWDVVASGPDDDTSPPENQFEVCSPAAGDVCKAGIEGSGAGQLTRPGGLAVDGAGGVYVWDRENHRVQKFGPAGNFLLMFEGRSQRNDGRKPLHGRIWQYLSERHPRHRKRPVQQRRDRRLHRDQPGRQPLRRRQRTNPGIRTERHLQIPTRTAKSRHGQSIGGRPQQRRYLRLAQRRKQHLQAHCLGMGSRTLRGGQIADGTGDRLRR